jgi:hypothetical protein
MQHYCEYDNHYVSKGKDSITYLRCRCCSVVCSPLPAHPCQSRTGSGSDDGNSGRSGVSGGGVRGGDGLDLAKENSSGGELTTGRKREDAAVGHAHVGDTGDVYGGRGGRSATGEECLESTE